MGNASTTLWPFINSVLLLLVGALLSFVMARHWFLKTAVAKVAETAAAEQKAAIARLAESAAAEKKELLARVAELERQGVLLHSQVEPISAAWRAFLIEKLTHNHTPEMDDLLRRIDDLSPAELGRLEQLLKERVVEYDDPEIGELERDAASILLIVHKFVQAERGLPFTATSNQIVSVPIKVSEDEK